MLITYIDSLFPINDLKYLNLIQYLIVMEDTGKPDPRWNEFIEEFDTNGKLVGFKLPDNNFLFEYDVDGGWEDEQGRYYNAEGVLQPDDESEDDPDDEDELSDHDDEVVDQFEELLREEEEGIVREASPKKPQGEVKMVKEQKDKNQLDFQGVLEKYKSKERLRENLPSDLFIYFKQRTDFYEQVTPIVQKLNAVQTKNAAVKEIKAKIEQKRKGLLSKYDWLKEEGVFLDFSGDSEKETFYDRYWYGVIRTNQDRYLEFIDKIDASKEFKILEIKTFYALKSKFYLKKAEPKIRATIADLKAKIQPLDGNKTVSLLFDNLPEKFPCSYVYDLVEYVGGKLEHVESVIIEDDFSATVTCLKPTALLLANIEGYNHDKGLYIQISFNQAKERVYAEGKHAFYYITVESQHKIHERELHDTLALQSGKTEIARQFTKEEEKLSNVRFAVGSIAALKRVLMFRGDTLNVVRVLPSVPK